MAAPNPAPAPAANAVVAAAVGANNVATMRTLLGATQVRDDIGPHVRCIVWTHPNAFVNPAPPAYMPGRTMVVMSRDSGTTTDLQQMCLENIVYAITAIHSMPNIVFNRLIIFHVRHRSSQNAIPDATQGNLDNKWGPFLQAIGRTRPLSDVDIFIRGWDGASTNAAGWVQFIRRFGSGQGQGNQPALNFRFWYFQPRHGTSDGIKDLFGRLTAATPPGPAPRWWERVANPNDPSNIMENCMRARVHPPFTHQQYLQAVNLSHTAINQANRNANPILAIMHVWAKIDQAKANGDTTLFNNNRNNFPFP